MRTPSYLHPQDTPRRIGSVFGTPLVTVGWTWLPLFEVIIWLLMTWVAGRRQPRRSLRARVAVGALTMPGVVASEWLHNFAHAAAARWIGQPMDALRIAGGTPLVVYYTPNDPNVTPRQHIVRTLGGPLFNTLLIPLLALARHLTRPDTLARECVEAWLGTNIFLSTVAYLPSPFIDGGPLLKWSLIARGHTPHAANRVVRRGNALFSVIFAGLATWFLARREWVIGVTLAWFAAFLGVVGFGLLRDADT